MTMLRDLNVVANGKRDSTDPRVGVLASEIPSGFPLESWLLNDIDSAFPSRLYSLEILTLPSAGTLYLNKAGVGSFVGAPNGTYTGTQRVYKYDAGSGLVSTADTTYSLAVGQTVTSVSVSPATASGAQTFTAVVTGENSPSQAVTWSVSAGSITSGGVFTPPPPTYSIQTITVTATSVVDPSKFGTATVTIAALPPKTASAVLVNSSNVVLPNITSLKWSWFDATTPDQFGAPTDKGAVAATSADGTLTVTLVNTTLNPGQVGWLIVTDSDGNPTTRHRAFSGPVTVA